MHNSTSRHDTRRQGRRARVNGLLGATAIATSVLATSVLATSVLATSVLAAGASADAIAAPSLPLHDARTGSRPVCPDDGLAAWHFVLAPADGTRQFASISLELDGTTHTFTDSMIVPNDGRPDDVFVEVPPGLGLSSLAIDASSATVSPAIADTTFALVDDCDGVVPDTAVSSASSAGGTDVAEPVESATVAAEAPPVPCSYEPGYVASDPACTPSTGVEAICVEIDTAGGAVRSWYRVTNDEDRAVTYEWVDGSVTVEPEATEVISTDRAALDLAVDGVEVAFADATDAICAQDVEVTKAVVGPAPDGTTYTFVVSRQVDGVALPEGAPVQIGAGQTVTLSLPSTLDPSGVEYSIRERDAGAAAISDIAPGSIVVSGHGGEPIGVTITNTYAAIELDKQVSQTDGVEPGDRLVYSLTATNTGALPLGPIVIVDRLPVSVAYRAATIVDGTGTCTLVDAVQPQLVQCELDEPVLPGASAATVELEVTVDDDAAGAEISNQALAMSSFAGLPVAADPARRARTAGFAVGGLSCAPAADEVCATSALVSSGVVLQAPTTTIQASAGPVPTSSTTTTTTFTSNPVAVAAAGPVTGAPTLPSTGTETSREIAFVSLAALAAGLALLLGSRRTARAA